MLKPTMSNWLKVDPWCLQRKCGLMNLVFGSICLTQIFKEIMENECVNKRCPFVKGNNLTNTAR